MSDRPTPETDAKASPHIGFYSCATVPANFARALEQERDEARAIAYDLASVASHCLGWHDHESSEAAERISSVLKRWKGEQ